MLWFVRAGLFDPAIVPQAFKQFCADFPSIESKAISRQYVADIRNAFAGVLKSINREQVASLVIRDAQGASTMYIQHRHDEGQMRMRSFAGVSAEGLHHPDLNVQGQMKLARSRLSKCRIMLSTSLQPLAAWNGWQSCNLCSRRTGRLWGPRCRSSRKILSTRFWPQEDSHGQSQLL
jgi:hypothetical protein